MGQLIDGVWHDVVFDTKTTGGRFQRASAQFRNWLTRDGENGPNGETGFPAESGRYHLYISLACPWAHRTLIYRQLKELQDHIGLTVVHPHMLENGWAFDPDTGADPLYGHAFMHQIYTHALPDYSGRVTVPVLWDKKTETIVSNESSEIIRMLNGAFDHITGNDLDLYPAALRGQIDDWNDLTYPAINNGVYRTGFASTQAAYDEAFDALFDALDRIESHLSSARYLTGHTITEADWRLFPTLIRFDAVYHGHFKCNRKRIADYPNISNYVRDLYQQPGIADTVNFEHIKQHYYFSHRSLNPTQIVAKGPEHDFDAPHDRGRF